MGQEHGRHLHLLDRQRVVHETLAVALLELETAHFVLHQRHIGHRPVLDDLHLAVDDITEQSCAAFGIGVIDVVVYLGNADALLDQHRHGAEQLRREERVGEVARVGHDAHVERLGHLPRNGIGAEQRFDDAVYEETGARRIGIREREVEMPVGRKVVVDQHAARRGVGLDRIAQDFEPRHGVEVEAEEQVGLGDGAHGIARGIVLEDHDLADTRHPVEKIGVFVRDDARYLVSHSPQHLGPCERRTHGIAVGIGMGDNHDLPVCRGEKFPEGFDTLFR